MEEKNAALACACEECENSDDLANCAEFFRLLRKQHLKLLRASLADEDDYTAVCSQLSIDLRARATPSHLLMTNSHALSHRNG